MGPYKLPLAGTQAHVDATRQDHMRWLHEIGDAEAFEVLVLDPRCAAAPAPHLAGLGVAILRRRRPTALPATLVKDVFRREAELPDGLAHPFERRRGLFLVRFCDQLLQPLLLRKQVLTAFRFVAVSLVMMDDSTRLQLLSSPQPGHANERMLDIHCNRY